MDLLILLVVILALIAYIFWTEHKNRAWFAQMTELLKAKDLTEVEQLAVTRHNLDKDKKTKPKPQPKLSEDLTDAEFAKHIQKINNG